MEVGFGFPQYCLGKRLEVKCFGILNKTFEQESNMDQKIE